MKIRWVWLRKQYPELESLSPVAGERVFIMASARLQRHPPSQWMSIASRACKWLVVLFFPAGCLLDPVFFILFGFALIMGAALEVITPAMRRHRLGKFITEAIERIDERQEFCLSCGYDLRGSTAEQCPECGTAVIYLGSEVIDEKTQIGRSQKYQRALRTVIGKPPALGKRFDLVTDDLPLHVRVLAAQRLRSNVPVRVARSIEAVLLVMFFGLGVIMITAMAYDEQIRQTESIVLGASILACVVVVVLHGMWHRRYAARLISAIYRDHGLRPGMCIICRNTLDGETGLNCPECGEALAAVGEGESERG